MAPVVDLQNTGVSAGQALLLHHSFSLQLQTDFGLHIRGEQGSTHKPHFIPYSLDIPHHTPTMFFLLFLDDCVFASLRAISGKNHLICSEVCLRSAAGQDPGKHLLQNLIHFHSCSHVCNMQQVKLPSCILLARASSKAATWSLQVS